MTGLTDFNIALLGTIGALTFSLFSTKAIKCFVGVGFFSLAFFLAYLFSNDLNLGVVIGLALALLAVMYFNWLLKVDLVSAILLVFVATIGIIVIINLLLNIRLEDLNIRVFSIRNFYSHNIDLIKQLQQIDKILK